MVEHLTVIAVMALVASGAYVSMGNGMALAWFRVLAERIPEPWRHPLSSCSYCMVSVWGTAAVYALCIAPVWYTLPVYWLCAAGLQSLFSK